jgi:ribose transport system substrate-binding protein
MTSLVHGRRRPTGVLPEGFRFPITFNDVGDMTERKSRMKKRIVAGVAAALALPIVLVGCSSPGGSASAGATDKAAGKDLTFVVVPKVVHAWFDEVNKGAQKEAALLSEKLGVKVTVDYRAPQKADVAEQNTILEQAAATKPDGIALDPLDYAGNKAVIDEIIARGIPVILFDSPSPAGSGLTSVGNNFSEQAQLASNKLAELIGGKGKVAVMQGVPTAPNHAERYKAHLAALAKFPGIEVVDGGIDNDSIEQAQSQAAAVLAANPDLKGYLNVDATGAGLAAAVEEAGRADSVKVVTMDNLIDILNYVKKGTITATSSTMPQEQGAFSVATLWQASIGASIPKGIDTGIAYIDSSNIDDWIKTVGTK